jgi:lipoprotein NlpI
MRISILLFCLTVAHDFLQAEDALSEKTRASIELYRDGKEKEAIDAVSRLIAANPKETLLYNARAQMFEGQRDFKSAILDYSALLKLEPGSAKFYQSRGAAHFRAGNIVESIEDYDKYLAAYPDREPYHWQRGISHYYAGRFKEGAAQFELHRSVNPNDVENSVFHFICNVPLVGVQEAREGLIPIKQDVRIPMMKVLDMYAGRATPEAVLARANEGNPPAHILKNQLFYAHLYIGLYYEALGKKQGTAKHVRLAATEYFSPHYMGDVARVHWEILKKKAQQPK